MKPNDLLELFRLELDDLYEPYLWSDKEFYIYLNEAQDTFVREIGGISDRRSSITRIAYKSGDQFKTYNARILRVKGAQDADNRFITAPNLDSFDHGNFSDDYSNRGDSGLDDSLTGPIRYLLTDVDAKSIQFYPLPDEDGTLQLFVERLPIEPVEDEDSVFEVADQYHLDLLCWVKYKSLLKQDGETFDGSKAADFRKMFDEGVGRAKKEKAARQDRKRVVTYGGL